MTKAVKKIVILVMTMLIGAFALSGCDNVSLDKYKVTGKSLINAHADTKVQENSYTEANLQVIATAVAEGKAAVDAAENKAAVDKAVSTAKEAINMVSRKLNGVTESNGDPASPIWTAFKSDESRLKVGDDLTIKFYYAPQSSYDINTYDPAPVAVTAKIIMGHSIYGNLDSHGGNYSSTLIEEYVLKEINNFADANNYPAAGMPAIAFEEIIISAEWFVGERGGVTWSVAAELTWANGTGIEPRNHGGGVALYYRIEGENIILYSSYYDFFNDIRN